MLKSHRGNIFKQNKNDIPHKIRVFSQNSHSDIGHTFSRLTSLGECQLAVKAVSVSRQMQLVTVVVVFLFRQTYN